MGATTAGGSWRPLVLRGGRWLAYTSLESGVPEVYVRPFPDAASARWQVSTAGGGDPVWSHSGRELFYRGANEQLMTVAIHPGATFSFEQPKPLFSTANYVNINPAASFDVSPDDKRFLFLREANLPLEALGAELGGELGEEHLERDGAVVAEIVREVHDRHPAPAEFALDGVTVGERVAQSFRHAQGGSRGRDERVD